MNKKVLIATILSFLVYSTILGCIGVFGSVAQPVFIAVSLFILKYGAITLGYAIAVLLPFRVAFALAKNKKRRAESARQAALEEQILRSKKLEADIANAYLREEDDI